MKSLKIFSIPFFCVFFFASCGSEASSDQSDNTKKEVTESKPLQTRPEAPLLASMTKFKTSQEDLDGSILSKEIYNDKGLRKTYIGYDFYGSGEETDRTTYEYDEAGNKIKMTSTDEDGMTTTNTYTYDASGNETGSAWNRSNGQGAKEESIYNENGDLLETKYYTAKGVYDYSRVNEYAYDELGNIIEEKRFEKYSDGSADLLMYHIQYTYDEQNNVIEKLSLNDLGEVYSRTVSVYDGNGLETEKQEFEGEEMIGLELFFYNEFGELIKDEAYSSIDVLNYTDTYEYDDYGRMTRMSYVHVDGENWGERLVYEDALNQ